MRHGVLEEEILKFCNCKQHQKPRNLSEIKISDLKDTSPTFLMDESPRARRSASETGQYINFDVAMHKMSNGWEESPKLRRAMQMSLESHEEFEFTMSHMAMKDDFFEPAMEVAPADELFFRGQLLPLQHDPRLQLVHTLSGIRGEHSEEQAGLKSIAEEEIAMKLAYEEAFPFAPTDADAFYMDRAHEEKPSVAHANDEEGFGVQERNSSTMRSHGSDAAMEASKNDSRSSSFRSQQSSYWGSGEKDSRDSSSSSRCSNGSSQDAYLHGAERKALHLNKAMVNGSVNAHAKFAAGSADGKAPHHHHHHHHLQDSKPPLPTSKVKKWSWKTLFTGLKKASKVWMDDRGNEHIASHRDAHKQKKSVFGFSLTLPTDRGMEKDEYDRQMGKSSHMGCVDTKRAGQHGRGSRGRSLAYEEYGGQMHGKYYTGNGAWRGYNFYEGSHGGRPGKEKARLGIIAWNARESWQRWVKRPLYGKPSHTHKHTASMHEDLQSFDMKAKSLSSTPLAKSPVRRADNVCHDPDYDIMPAKFTNLGFAASCPASMRSSPHHSGVLAVVNKAPAASSLHDLHTAIQGAIAHCKQSQTANLV